ncbi:uncharacterized protein LAESUDRAFT_195841 [Laetiporus sulphureus 93-53]|uniref:DUF6533 domain-containing protein n=1 Tax=Laetiporus sulphureus 93-53 TaxID=1314785 RepID=A0A165E1G0_9APHY|nr:uncharacterized protein LAESUDRAFT_195841 [Laetiporus sulphureus 93-53]KZT06064.1 hypothetical protein LAESUDRAFT_195841 [Laetiporus sulphureus 93-53]
MKHQLCAELLHCRGCWYAVPLAGRHTFRSHIMNDAALVLYDNLLTISQEAELIWARKRTVASTLFALNRWFSIGYAVSMILLIPQWTTSQVSAFTIRSSIIGSP